MRSLEGGEEPEQLKQMIEETLMRSTTPARPRQARPRQTARPLALLSALLSASLISCQRPHEGYIEPADERPGLLSHPPALFEPSPTSVTLWARAREEGAYYVEVAELPAGATASDLEPLSARAPSLFSEARRTATVEARKERDLTLSIPVEGLTPHRSYALRLRAAARPGAELPTRYYRAGREGALRLAWTADLFAGRRPFKLFEQVRAAAPDALALLGDTIYADYPPRRSKNLSDLRWHHRLHRAEPHLRAALAEVPTLATWDDHEVANNFDRAHPLAAAGRRAFLEYWPARLTRPPEEGLYRSVAWGDLAEVFMLDARSMRVNPPGAPPEARALLGEEQGRWLREGLKSSRAAFKLVLSSVPVGLPGWPDTWDGFPLERAALLEWLKEQKIEGVVFLSGDLHLACDASSPSHTEVVAGPAGAWTFKELFPRRVAELKEQGRWHLTDQLNFGLADLKREGDTVTLTLTIRDLSWREHLVKRLARRHPSGASQ